MDFLNKFYDQLRDLFASMTPGARITTGVLLAVVVVSLGFLFKQSTSGPGVFLYGGEPLTRQEVVRVMDALSQAGLSDYTLEGNLVRVPSGQQHLYMAAIADAGASPKNPKSFIDDAINNYSPFAPGYMQKQSIKAADEKELSHVISQMTWVENAVVKYDQKEVRGPGRNTIASATVNVTPKPGEGVDTKRRKTLQQMVAGSFASMKPDQVVVTNLNGDDFDGAGGASPDDFESVYLAEKARYENSVRAQVKSHLSYIPGVRVQVNAELDRNLRRQEQSTRPEGTPALISVEETEDESKSLNSNGGDPPGGSSQGPARRLNETVAAKQNSTETKSRTSKELSKPGEITTITEISGLVPEKMWASIQVPMDYVVGVWRKNKIANEGQAPELVDTEEVRLVENNIIESIKTAVEPLMTELSAGQNDFTQVKVVTYQELPGDPIKEPSASSKAMFWAQQHGGTVAMLGLAAFSLVMLRSMVRSTGNEPSGDSPGLKLQMGDHDAASSDEVEEDGKPKLRFKKPDTTKDELADMVREDPDAAAAILSNWISKAS